MAEKCSNYSVVNTKENKTGNVCKVTQKTKHASFMDNTKTWFGKVKKKKKTQVKYVERINLTVQQYYTLSTFKYEVQCMCLIFLLKSHKEVTMKRLTILKTSGNIPGSLSKKKKKKCPFKP